VEDGARIQSELVDSPGASFTETQTVDGQFKIGPVPDGRYRVTLVSKEQVVPPYIVDGTVLSESIVVVDGDHVTDVVLVLN
jgi:hypothetical protein